MGHVYKSIGAAALGAVAILLHTFYIGYQTNAETYIVSWPSPAFVHDNYLELVAQATAKPERSYKKYGSNDRVVFEEVTYEQAMEMAKAKHPSTRHGMVPSWASAGRGEPDRTAMARSLWLGVILPATLLFGALGLIASAIISIRQRKIHGAQAAPNQPLASHSPTLKVPMRPATTTQTETLLLGEALKARFGKDLGVAGGDASREAPLVITDEVDYVAIEYAAAKLLMEGMEWQKRHQAIMNLAGRSVDEITFLVRLPGEADWQEQKFYFDITAGFRSGR